MGLLEDRVALIAGVGVDLGSEGARLVLGARSEDTIRALAREIEGMGRRCVWQRAEAELGGLDIPWSTTPSGPTEKAPWRRRTSQTGEPPWT